MECALLGNGKSNVDDQRVELGRSWMAQMQSGRAMLQGRRRSDGRGAAAQDANTGLLQGMAIPIIVIGFVTIFAPIWNYSDSLTGSQFESGRNENKIFWPVVAIAAFCIYSSGKERLNGAKLPLHIGVLIVLLVYCGLSIAWAFSPQLSTVRYGLQIMICTAIVLPIMVARPSSDVIFGAFLCFALAAFINVYYVQIINPAIVARLQGYPGFYEGKNYLGEFMGIAFVLALSQLIERKGAARVLALAALPAILYCLLYSNSKTALALAVMSPVLALGITLASRLSRLSPAIVIGAMLLTIYAAMLVTGVGAGRISYGIYGDASFSGRTVIWDYLYSEFAQKWLLGWGYNSFWLVGPEGPSIVNAPGWVKTMPSGHSGYIDAKVELGYVGYALLLALIFSTLHLMGIIVGKSVVHAWSLLSLTSYILMYNFIETGWLKGYEILWVMFLVVAAETARFAMNCPQAEAPKVETGRRKIRANSGAEALKRRPRRQPLDATAYGRNPAGSVH